MQVSLEGFIGGAPGSKGILETTREVLEAMRLGTDLKAATGPGSREPVMLADGGNPPSASLTTYVLQLGQGHGIPEDARVNVCPKGDSWFAVGADDVRQDIRRSASSTYLVALVGGAHGKKPRLPHDFARSN